MNTIENKLEIFTDGACSGNPGPGGWGVILCWPDKQKEMYGGEKDTTNNRMELLACLLYTSPSPRDGLLSRMPSSA